MLMFSNELMCMMHALAGQPLPKEIYSPDFIINAVVRALYIPAEVIKSDSRERAAVDARFIAMHIINKELDIKPADLAMIFNRDRTTAINALKTSAALVDNNRVFYAKMKLVETVLEGLK